MTKVKNNLKHLLAVTVALMMVFGACFTGVLTVSADTAVPEGLTHYATVSDNVSAFQGGWVSETDIEGGGVKLHWGALSAYFNFFYDEVLGTAETGAFPGTYGFSLHFDGYTKTAKSNYGDGIIAVSFTHTAGYSQIKTGVPFIMIDTNKGTLSVAHGTSSSPGKTYDVDQTVIVDDILKYDNIKEVPFTIEFSCYSDTKTQVSVNVNGTYAAGLMTTSFITNGKSGPNAGNHYIFANIGGLENNTSANAPFDINFYGHKLFDSTYTAPALTASGLTKGLTDIATASDNAEPFNPGWASYKDIIEGVESGVHMSWTALSGDLMYEYSQTLGSVEEYTAFPGTYGTKLQFGGYKCTLEDGPVGNRMFVLSFVYNKAYGEVKDGVPFLLFDTNAGTLSLAHGTGSIGAYELDEVIITDDMLLYDNFKNRPFSVSVSTYDSNYITVELEVDGSSVAGVFQKSNFFGRSESPNQGNPYFYVSIGGLDNSTAAGNNWELDFYGFKRLEESYTAPAIKVAGLAAGLTDVATAADNAQTTSSGWVTYTDKPTGGFRLWTGCWIGDVNFIYNQNIAAAAGGFPGTKGFLLQFGNYVNNNTDSTLYGNGIITLALTKDTTNTEVETGIPFLMLNTNDGTLSLAHGTGTSPGVSYEIDETIITSDVLKYENITGKAFTVEIVNGDENYAIVAMTVDGTQVYGLMTMSLFSAQTYAATSSAAYMSLASLNNSTSNSFSIDFYGYKVLDDTYTVPTIEPSGLAAGLTDVATESDNADPYDAHPWYSYTDIVTGGVKLSYTRWTADKTYVYGENIGAFPGTKGFMLQFDGYENTVQSADEAGDGLVTIALSNDVTKTNIVQGVPFLMLDTNNGTLSLGHGTSTTLGQYEIDTVIIESDTLKLASIAGKPFTVEFVALNESCVIIAVTVDGTQVSGLLPLSKLNAQTYAPADNCYIALGGMTFGSDNKWKLNFYGYKLLDDTYVTPEVTIPEYEGTLAVGDITVDIGETDKAVSAAVSSNYLDNFTALTVSFTANGETTAVTEYTVVGDTLVFTYTTAADADVAVKLAGTYIYGTAYESAQRVVNLSRFTGEAGAKYVQFEDIDCGDANGDGVTDVKDLVRAKKIIAELAEGDADLSGNGTTETGDLTLLAKLLTSAKKGIRVYTVTFADSLDDSVIGTAIVPEGHGAAFIIAPDKDGYTFTNWSQDTITDVNSDITVYAVYEAL